MKMYIKPLIIVIILLSLICGQAFAAEYEDTLRVGIYYGSGTVSSLTIKSDLGIYAGVVAGRDFTPVVLSEAGSAIIEPDTVESVPSHHVLYSSHQMPEDALNASTDLFDAGMDVFIGYINSEYCVLGGSYKNNNDALWAAENLAVKGTPLEISAKAIRAIDPATKKTLFVTKT